MLSLLLSRLLVALAPCVPLPSTCSVAKDASALCPLQIIQDRFAFRDTASLSDAGAGATYGITLFMIGRGPAAALAPKICLAWQGVKW